jgi:hypothetical protein
MAGPLSPAGNSCLMTSLPRVTRPPIANVADCQYGTAAAGATILPFKPLPSPLPGGSHEPRCWHAPWTLRDSVGHR